MVNCYCISGDIRLATEVLAERMVAREPNRYKFVETVSYFLYAVGPLVGNAVLALLGAIATDFTVNPTAVLIAFPAFMLPFASFQLFSGAISDVYGRIPVMLSGLVAFAIGLSVTAYATSLGIFVLGNVICGVGFAFVNPVVIALLTDSAASENIPKRMGIVSAMASLSAGLGPFIAGQMLVLGWRSYYLMFLLIVLIGLISVSVAGHPPRRSRESRGLRAFIENLTAELKRPSVVLMACATFLVSLVYLGTLVWTSRALVGAVDPIHLGILLLAAGTAGATAGSLLGPLARRHGFGLPIGLGFLTLFGGLSLLILIGDIAQASLVPFVGLSLAAVGWAGGTLFPAMTTYSQMVSPTRRGVLAGVVTFGFFLGAALVPTLFGPLFQIGISAVYIGMLGVSAILMLLFAGLYRKLERVRSVSAQGPLSVRSPQPRDELHSETSSEPSRVPEDRA